MKLIKHLYYTSEDIEKKMEITNAIYHLSGCMPLI